MAGRILPNEPTGASTAGTVPRPRETPPRSAAVSRLGDQPQQSPISDGFVTFKACASSKVAAAGLRHSRAPRTPLRVAVALSLAALTLSAAPAPDISTIPPDLTVPPVANGAPTPGKRVRQVHPDYAKTDVHHLVYLPTDWKPDGRYPVIVEYAGNGPYSNKFGDISTGEVEGSKLGYGISAGKGFIWVCLPYLNEAGTANVTRWWGDHPTYNPQPTIDYCLKTVPWICRKYGGDSKRVVLAGFSRGAIACNFIGLHDDSISALWRAFIPYSHYDGAKTHWPYPGDDRKSAAIRLRRLKGRPQFICHEGERPMSSQNLEHAKGFIKSTGIEGDFTYLPTGFRNHNDAWTLRPSPARDALRRWLKEKL